MLSHLPGSHKGSSVAPGTCVAPPGQALHMVSGPHTCTASTTDNHLPRPPWHIPLNTTFHSKVCSDDLDPRQLWVKQAFLIWLYQRPVKCLQLLKVCPSYSPCTHSHLAISERLRREYQELGVWRVQYLSALPASWGKYCSLFWPVCTCNLPLLYLKTYSQPRRPGAWIVGGH